MAAFPFHSSTKRIVVTGGPGAGKTAVLELARRDLCPHVEILPEAASIVFGGGFPRRQSVHARRAAQRAIYHVQDELEAIALGDDATVAALCDRGTVDALAYWPGSWEPFFESLGTSLEDELGRYAAVLHLRVPENATLYQNNRVRIETHEEALRIDARLLEVWSTHPRRFVVDGTDDFVTKAHRAIDILRTELAHPDCTAKRASA